MALDLKQLDRTLSPRTRKSVRDTLFAHLDAGKPLNAEGYRLLLATYENVKPDKKIVPALDDLVGIIEGPGGTKLLKHASGLAVLSQLAKLLAATQRWEQAMRMHELYFAYQKSLSIDLHKGLFQVANRLGPEALARALSIHDRVVKRRPAMLDITAIKVAATRALKTVAKAGIKSSAPPSTSDELGALISAIRNAGGAKGYDGATYSDPKPLPAATIKKLKLANGSPLPPSIAQWLAFDGSWIPLFKQRGVWDSVTLAEFFGTYAESIGLKASLGADFARAHVDRTHPKTPVVVLPPSGNQDNLLVIDRADKKGEAPVYARRKETIFLKYASFGEFLVHYLSPVGAAPAKKKTKATSKAPAAGKKTARSAPKKKVSAKKKKAAAKK